MGKKSAKDGGLNHAMVLAFAGAAATAAGAPSKDANGQPARRYAKDLIRVGEFYLPAQDRRVEVTAAMLEGWVATFNAMKADGVKVPIPSGHTNDAEANRGYVVEMYVEGDTLFGVLELIGEDAIKLASRAEVSIATMDLVAGNGKTYANAIAHVAIVTDPVVPDQDGFVPIAASRGGAVVKVPLFRMAVHEGSNMEWKKKIAAMLGVEVAEGMTEEQLAEAILKHVEAMKASGDPDAKKVEEVAAALRASQAEVVALKASRGTKPETNPQIIKLSAKNRTSELSRLVTEGRITPAVRDRLAACWLGKDNGALKLSLDDESDRRFDEMVAALGENDPVKLGEQTAAQGVALSRHAPGDTSRVDPVANDKYMAERLAALKPKNGA